MVRLVRVVVLASRCSSPAAVLALAGCARGPRGRGRKALQQQLDAALGGRVLTVERFTRAGSAPARGATDASSISTRSSCWRATTTSRKWDAHNVASLAALLGAGPKGIVGLKEGGNRKGRHAWRVRQRRLRARGLVLAPARGGASGRRRGASARTGGHRRRRAARPAGAPARRRRSSSRWPGSTRCSRARRTRRSARPSATRSCARSSSRDERDAPAPATRPRISSCSRPAPRTAPMPRRPRALEGAGARGARGLRGPGQPGKRRERPAAGRAQGAVRAGAERRGAQRASGTRPLRRRTAGAARGRQPVPRAGPARGARRRRRGQRRRSQGQAGRTWARTARARGPTRSPCSPHTGSAWMPLAEATALSAGGGTASRSARASSTRSSPPCTRPARALQRAFARTPLVLVPIGPARELLDAGFVPLTLPARTYARQAGPVPTVAATAMLVTRPDVPQAQVEAMTALLFDRKEGAGHRRRGPDRGGHRAQRRDHSVASGRGGRARAGRRRGRSRALDFPQVRRASRVMASRTAARVFGSFRHADRLPRHPPDPVRVLRSPRQRRCVRRWSRRSRPRCATARTGSRSSGSPRRPTSSTRPSGASILEWTAEALRGRLPLAVTVAEPSVHGQVAFVRAAQGGWRRLGDPAAASRSRRNGREGAAALLRRGRGFHRPAGRDPERRAVPRRGPVQRGARDAPPPASQRVPAQGRGAGARHRTPRGRHRGRVPRVQRPRRHGAARVAAGRLRGHDPGARVLRRAGGDLRSDAPRDARGRGRGRAPLPRASCR